jgi:hypothetical protein
MKNDIPMTELTDAELQMVTGGDGIYGGGTGGSTLGSGSFQTSTVYGTSGASGSNPLTGFVQSGATSNNSTASIGGMVFGYSGPTSFV